MSKQKLIVLTGAGISAESGISTFRDSNGLWENHSIEDVATPEGWRRNPALVHEFYNQRRKQLFSVEPNAAHRALVELENDFEVIIITQNVDDLHERAGSKNVLHLHGELLKMRSSGPGAEVFDVKPEKTLFTINDKCPKGYPLRPHIVWFGEAVPAIETAIEWVQQADILVIVGTSMQVYPAAGLINYCPKKCKKYYIDPNAKAESWNDIEIIAQKATSGMAVLQSILQE
jgi:NAD-dependent deacetylase